MFKEFIKTLVGGALGFAALYFTAKIAYQAGRDVERVTTNNLETGTEETQTTNEHVDETEKDICNNVPAVVGKPDVCEKPRKLSKLAMALGIHRAVKKDTVIGRFLRRPEDHKLEAYVDHGGLRINVKPLIA